MLVAVALRSHVFSAVLLLASEPVKSCAAPLALTKQREFKNVKSAEVSSFWPFLLLQNPSVNPPPAPKHTLPNCTFFVSFAARSTPTSESMVCIQFDSSGWPSTTVYVPGSRTRQRGVSLVNCRLSSANSLNSQPLISCSVPSFTPLAFAS